MIVNMTLLQFAIQAGMPLVNLFIGEVIKGTSCKSEGSVLSTSSYLLV